LKTNRKFILPLLLLSPLTVFASGQEILVVAFVEFILIVIFLLIIWNLDLNRLGKSILTITYFLSTYLTFHFINTGAYFENLALTNTSIAVIPSIVIIIAYLALRSKCKINN
jgi:hypothetical protein